MHAPKRALLVSLLAGAAAAGAAVGACTSVDGQSPMCTPNVDQNGIHPDPNGCDQFPTCDKPQITDCCTDADGGALTGNDLATCRHGYGDPACAFLAVTADPMNPNNVTYTCQATPPGGSPDGG